MKGEKKTKTKKNKKKKQPKIWHLSTNIKKISEIKIQIKISQLREFNFSLEY